MVVVVTSFTVVVVCVSTVVCSDIPAPRSSIVVVVFVISVFVLTGLVDVDVVVSTTVDVDVPTLDVLVDDDVDVVSPSAALEGKETDR